MSSGPIKLIDIELSEPVADVDCPGGYGLLQALARLHGQPVGYVRVPLREGRCPAETLRDAILSQHSANILRHLLRDRLATDGANSLSLPDLLNTSHPVYEGPLPSMTVAVCSRDRPADLARCLDSLVRLSPPVPDILVVDNAPSDDATERLVRSSYPNVRYVREPRPGLDWARNRAIAEAQGEILAYTDDDVVVDMGWAGALARTFGEHPEVMAVTGLVVPYELETEAQILFELYGGFGRGFERKWYRVSAEQGERASAEHSGAGKFGTGANMAYRRSLFDKIGGFDPALDVGTVTNGGGDLEMFFRVLKEGYTLVYEPGAMVRHRHRRDYTQLRTQITNNGIGFYSYLVRSSAAYTDERYGLFKFGLWWLWRWNVRRLLTSFLRRDILPRDLILAELRGSIIGLGRYRAARREAAGLARR